MTAQQSATGKKAGWCHNESCTLAYMPHTLDRCTAARGWTKEALERLLRDVREGGEG